MGLYKRRINVILNTGNDVLLSHPQAIACFEKLIRTIVCFLNYIGKI